MQGTRVLPLLLALAVAAGFVLYSKANKRRGASGEPASPAAAARAFVEEQSGLEFRSDPAPVAVANDAALAARIEGYLDRRFGPSGLARRTRALELLGALPPGQNLRGQFLAAEASGVRTWFDDLDGTLYLAPGFDPAQRSDQAALIAGLARLLVHQHHPPGSFRNDDHWMAWRGIAGGLATSLDAAFRASRPGGAGIPTSAETEREATLMSLPIYVHGTAQFPVFEGKDFLEIPGARSAILSVEPSSTAVFFRSYASIPALQAELRAEAAAAEARHAKAAALHRDVEAPSLRESLGPLGVRLFFERHADFDQANTLAANLELDSYVLFATGSGDHLRWTARFTAPTHAEQARSLLTPWKDSPSPASDPRFKRIDLDGTTITVTNSSEEARNR